MSMLRSEDGDVSERELLVDDIQRIREVLHISAGHDNKLSSDEEEDEESEEEDEEDDEQEKHEEHSIIGMFWNAIKIFPGNKINLSSIHCDSCRYKILHKTFESFPFHQGRSEDCQ